MRGLILSAGLGERLRPLTNTRAKPAIEFLNVPMLGFPYYWLNTLKLKDLVFNTHYLPETVRHAAMHVVDPGIALHFPHEPAILGSGGGIANAKVYLQGDDHFIVGNGDGVILCEDDDAIERMLDFHIQRDALATLLVCPLEGVGTRIPGVWMDVYGEVANFGKAARKDYLQCFHYASVMILSRRIWSYLPDGPSNILYDILEPCISQGEKVYGYRLDGMRWFETGNAQDYLHATRDCLALLADPQSRLGQSLDRILEAHGPSCQRQSDIQRGLWIADQAKISDSASLNGFVVAGPDVSVEAYARLENVVVLPGATVTSGAVHREEVIISSER